MFPIDETYPKISRIYELYCQIKEIVELKKILIEDEFETHLHKCVNKTVDYTFMDEYVEEYLKLYPELINVKDKDGKTALMICRFSEKTLEILLKHGSDPNIEDKHGNTALIYAARSWYATNQVLILLKYGANVKHVSRNKSTALVEVLCHSKLPVDLIKSLVEHGADLTIKNDFGSTPVSIAFSKVYTLDFILTNRKKFFDHVPINRNKILSDRSKFWKAKCCDYKLIYKSVSIFGNILKFF